MGKNTESHLNKLRGDRYARALYLYSVTNIMPWVLYIDIKVRKDWFSYYWSTRGSNFKEIQLWILQINIGMPWLETPLKSNIRDYGTLEGVKKTNDGMLKRKWSVQIGTYPSVL
jgi:hypothetical protein